MTPNNNLSVLPFYMSLSKQNHRKDYVYGDIFQLFTPDRKILPFQIIRESRIENIVGVHLINYSTGVLVDITSQIIANGLTINRYESKGYDVIVYDGKLLLTSETPEGLYYLVLSDGVSTWYSEVYTVVRNTDSYLKIKYRDPVNLEFKDGVLDFSNNFYFELYLKTQVGKPEYEFDEQVDKRDGYQFIEKQISEKTYRFNFLAPEYLLDAMRIIRMMEDVTIYSNGDTYTIDQFLMTPKWQDGGALAVVEVEFQCDTIIKKIGKGYTPTNVLDFNNDFNNDFNDDFKN